jgi:hypothetical protein
MFLEKRHAKAGANSRVNSVQKREMRGPHNRARKREPQRAD